MSGFLTWARFLSSARPEWDWLQKGQFWGAKSGILGFYLQLNVRGPLLDGEILDPNAGISFTIFSATN
jgi:hypothetical protein